MDIETENVINLVFPNGIPGNIFLFFREKHIQYVIIYLHCLFEINF